MRRFTTPGLVLVAMTGLVGVGQAAAPSQETVRAVYAQLLAQADADKDGTISLAECKSIFTDPAISEKSCRFWDVNKDGAITEDEYVERVMRVTNRKNQ